MENRSNRKNKSPMERPDDLRLPSSGTETSSSSGAKMSSLSLTRGSHSKDSPVKPGNDKVNLVIVGSIGLDNVKTPVREVKSALGGSAVYASTAASFFTKPGIVGIVGQDLPREYHTFLNQFDCAGIVEGGETFRWSGFYENDMNEAKTLDTKLNSLAEFTATVPDNYKMAQFLLLGNIDPQLQLKVIKQMPNHPFIIMDTMNYWITSKKTQLLEAIRQIDFLVINDGEARLLCNTPNLISAGKQLLDLGPKYVAIKKGEHGALLFSPNSIFSAPAYPLESLTDPTGCGDSFAGGLIGYLTKTQDLSETNIRKAIIYGSAIASFCAQDFSLEYKKRTELLDIQNRYQILREICSL